MRAVCAVPGRVVSVDSRTKGNKMRRTMNIVAAVAVLVIGGTAVQRAGADGFAYWDPADGGNAHFYEQVYVPAGILWDPARQAAQQAGGDLVTITSAAEQDFVFRLLAGFAGHDRQRWLGGFQPPGSPEPDGGWQWVTGESFVYENWSPSSPNNDWRGIGQDEDRTVYGTNDFGWWDDRPGHLESTLPGYIVEYETLDVTIPGIRSRSVRDDCGPGCLSFDVTGFFASDGYTFDLPHDLTINGSNITLDIFANSPTGTPDQVITPFSTSAFFGPLNNGFYRDTINLYVDGELVDTLTGSFNVPIPEPGTVMLLLLGSAAVLGRRRSWARAHNEVRHDLSRGRVKRQSNEEPLRRMNSPAVWEPRCDCPPETPLYSIDRRTVVRAETGIALLSVVITMMAGAVAYADFVEFVGYEWRTNSGETDSVLKLTSARHGGASQATAFIRTPIAVDESTGIAVAFKFKIHDLGGASGADGFVFMLHNDRDGERALGGTGGEFGYGCCSDTMRSIENSVAVEFDTFRNGWDPNGNHVGIDLNGSVRSALTAVPPFDLNDGRSYFAWVEYAAEAQILTLFLAEQNSKPALPVLEHSINLHNVLGSQAFVGFGAGWGSYKNVHEIEEFSLTGSLRIPEPASMLMLPIGTALLLARRR